MGVSLMCSEELGGSRHSVCFYGPEEFDFTWEAGLFLREGLKQGEAALVFATPEHCETLARQLQGDTPDPSRLILQNAHSILARITVHGQPDRARFHQVVGGLTRDLRNQSAGLCAFGEMVALLWNAGESTAALRLEQYWNELLASIPTRLLCAYQIDMFGPEFRGGVLNPILDSHTAVFPPASPDGIREAVVRAAREILAYRAEAIFGPQARTSDKLGDAESAILRIRNVFPEFADEILGRARSYSRRPHFAMAVESKGAAGRAN